MKNFGSLAGAGALGLCLLAPPAARAAAKLPPLAPVPASMAEPQHAVLSQRRSQLEAELNGLRAAVARFNAETAEQQTKAQSDDIFQRRAAYLAKAEAFNREVAAAPPKAPPPQKSSVELAKVKGQIAELQEVLRHLLRSAALDGAQREEWEARSHRATLDAYKTTAKLSLSYISGDMKEEIDAAQKEVGSASDLLAGATDPARRDQLHAAFAALAAHRNELAGGLKMFQAAQSGAEVALDAMAPDEEPPPGVRRALEKAWDAGEKLHLIPEQAVLAKSASDYAYDSATQYFVWKRTGQLNANADKNLQAVARLQERMKALVAREKKLEP